jgi:hypothetical protein
MAGAVAALSVASDLTRGHPSGEAMRAGLVATELARRAGLDERDQGEPAEAMEFLGGLGVVAVRLFAMGGPAGVARLKAEGAGRWVGEVLVWARAP